MKKILSFLLAAVMMAALLVGCGQQQTDAPGNDEPDQPALADGVYTADPFKDSTATRYTQLSFDEAMAGNLGIMDATAFALCRDQKLPVKVFSIIKPGALKRVIMGEDEGTLVYA